MFRRLLFLSLAVLAGLVVLGAGDVRAEAPRSSVVVFLKANGAPAGAAAPAAAFAEVQAAEGAVIAAYSGDLEVTYKYRATPGFAASAGESTIDALRRDPRVAAVVPDFRGEAADPESFPLIHVPQAQALGYNGQGVIAAVIDSGIREDHADFAGAIVHEECFMAAFGLSSRCPDGSTRQSGSGAAHDDLGHGTNVSGIVAGRGTAAPIGMAPAATLEVMKIIDTHNSFYFSDLTAAIDHILASHPEIQVLNMSLGSFDSQTPEDCAVVSGPYDQLRAMGMLVFVASMNQRYKSGMGFPACVSSNISVGAVYDSDMASLTLFGCTDAPALADSVACWSNSHPSLDLLAPGCAITATGLNSTTSTYCGTSQASPTAAGLAALLIQEHPDWTADQVEARLKASGKLITDTANSVTTPRIDALAAVHGLQGDINCNLQLDSGDALAILTYAAGLPASGAAGVPDCPGVGGAASSAAIGDVDCDAAITVRDALDVLLVIAKLPPLPAPGNCPRPGDPA